MAIKKRGAWAGLDLHSCFDASLADRLAEAEMQDYKMAKKEWNSQQKAQRVRLGLVNFAHKKARLNGRAL